MAETLESKLAETRAGSAKRYPAEVRQTMQKMYEDLEVSHVPHIIDVGDAAPDFTLGVAGSGEQVTLSEAVKSGPAVLSFYRGQW